jgi:endonuclease/exonuclease/phosphatase family metal-dependent hydrolase
MANKTSKNTNYLRLMAWNANSITNKKDELADFMKRQKIHVCLVSETLLKPANKFKQHKHSTYRTDRATQGGGTAIIIRSDIQHHNIDLLPLNSMEATAVVVQTSKGPIKLVAVYKQPGKKLDIEDIDKICNSKMPTIVAGDFNCKHPAWHSKITTAQGRTLYNHCCKKQIQISGPVTPTHYPDNGNKPDVLDFVLSSNLQDSLEVTTVNALSSDHNPIIIEYGDTATQEDPLPARINIKRTDWKGYRDEITTKLQLATSTKKQQSEQEINNSIQHLTDIILVALTNNSPLAEPPKSHESLFALPTNIIKSIQAKNKVRRVWQTTRTPHIKALLNQMTKGVQEQIHAFKNKAWKEKIEQLNTQDNSLWQMTRCLTRTARANPPLHGTRGLVYTATDKANTMADTLENTFTPNDDPSDIDQIELVEDAVEDFSQANTQAPLSGEDICSPKEVRETIDRLKVKKAPGMDGIPNMALKQLPPTALVYLANVYNNMLRKQYFATSLKESKIILFAKPGKDPAFPQNYRPISLLSGFSKILERILLTRIMRHVDSTNLLIPEQFGFRKALSTTQQLLRVTELISNGFNNRKVTGAVFLDIAQAFDKVWHEGLIFKLIQLDFPPYMINIIKSYLQNRTFKAHMGTGKSTSRSIHAGVPQGSIIGPILFCLYINDMPKVDGVTYALYADDTALLAQSWKARTAYKQLQTALEALETWYELWRIKINVTKSVSVLFTRRRQPYTTERPELTLFDEDIPDETTAKYLGVTLDHRLTWVKHINNIITTGNKTLNILSPLLRNQAGMSIENATLLYLTIVRPTITYAAPVWATAKPTLLNRLQQVQNKALRRASKSPWFVRNEDIRKDLKVELLQNFILTQCTREYAKTKAHDNPLVKALGTHRDEENPKYPRPKDAIQTLTRRLQATEP